MSLIWLTDPFTTSSVKLYRLGHMVLLSRLVAVCTVETRIKLDRICHTNELSGF